MTTEVAVIGIDPGRNLGVAYLTATGSIVHTHCIPGGGTALRTALVEGTLDLTTAPIALGNGTGSEAVALVLTEMGLTYTFIDEKNSSREARELYFVLFPPRGLKKLVPRGLLSGPEFIDPFAAAIIAKRYLAQQSRTDD